MPAAWPHLCAGLVNVSMHASCHMALRMFRSCLVSFRNHSRMHAGGRAAGGLAHCAGNAGRRGNRRETHRASHRSVQVCLPLLPSVLLQQTLNAMAPHQMRLQLLWRVTSCHVRAIS